MSVHGQNLASRRAVVAGKRFVGGRSICRPGCAIMSGMANMVSGIAVAEIGALIGDAGRANMLHALMAGRALTAGELAWIANVSASTASEHLAKLTEARLIAVTRQGRH